MRKVLVVGDSLAGGMPHINFCALLKKTASDYRINACAVGGDPLSGICKRLGSLVPETRPDVVVMVAGANDILLPFLKARGGLWRRLVVRIERRGHLPVEDPRRFRDLYSRAVEKAAGEAERVIPTTITCLGENLANEPNRRRVEYNAVIREVAEKYHLDLADTAEAFEDLMLMVDDPSPYFMDDFRAVFTDALHTLTPRGADALSGRRGLVLTLDGVHFNRLGARTFARRVLRHL